MRLSEFLVEKQVASAWISDLTYNRPNKVLTMRLSNGKYFTIQGITRTLFDRWLKSPSKGRFYHDYIKDNYVLTRTK